MSYITEDDAEDIRQAYEDAAIPASTLASAYTTDAYSYCDADGGSQSSPRAQSSPSELNSSGYAYNEKSSTTTSSSGYLANNGPLVEAALKLSHESIEKSEEAVQLIEKDWNKGMPRASIIGIIFIKFKKPLFPHLIGHYTLI